MGSSVFSNYTTQVPQVQMRTPQIRAPADSDGNRKRLCAQPGDVTPAFHRGFRVDLHLDQERNPCLGIQMLSEDLKLLRLST